MLKKNINPTVFKNLIKEAAESPLGTINQTRVKHANNAFAVGDRVYIRTMEGNKSTPKWKTVKYVADDYSYLIIDGLSKNIEPSNNNIFTTDTWNMAIERMRGVCPEDFSIGMIKVSYQNFRNVRHVVLSYRSYLYAIPYDDLRSGQGEMTEISKDKRSYFLNLQTGNIISTTNDQGSEYVKAIPNRDWVVRDTNSSLGFRKSDHDEIKKYFTSIDNIPVIWVNDMGIGTKMKYGSKYEGGWIIWKGNPTPVYTYQHNGYMVPSEWVEYEEGTRNVLTRNNVSGEKGREDIETLVFVAWKWKYRTQICDKFPWLYEKFAPWIAQGQIKRCRPKNPYA